MKDFITVRVEAAPFVRKFREAASEPEENQVSA
jgi:hypothetical protein